MRRLAAALTIAVLLLAVRPEADAAVFEPTSFVLDNGMHVVVVENHRAPVVTHMVWYRVGAADEAPGRSGLAHFLEHLMFKGTATAPAGAFSRTVARLGGRDNAFTSSDYTAYFQTIAREHLETVMAMEADRMTNLVLDEKDVATERKVVLEERSQRVDNQPAALLAEHASAALYLNHPYRRPTIGWEHEIAGLTRADALDFYRKWYAPNNAILVVAGDITADELRPLAEKHYGAIPPAPPAPRLDLDEPEQLAPRRVTLSDVRVVQPTWTRTYLAPSYSTGVLEEVDALEVAADVLGGTQTSILYQRLVVDRTLAVAAGARYSANARGPTTLSIYAIPAPGVGMAELEAAVDAVLADVLAAGLDPESVARARDRMLADAVYARDSLSNGAFTLGAALATGRTVEDVETWPERIADLSAGEADAALRGVLDERRSVTSLLLPAEQVTAER